MSGSGGQVRQRPSGLWEGRYVGADGRRHSVYGKTKAEAQQKLRAALTAADNGIRPSSARLTVGQWLDEWLASLAIRPTTIESYEGTVRRYLKPALGRIPLTKLDDGDITRMLTALQACGDLSPTTVRYAYVVLRIALGRALKRGLVVRNVATLVDPPKAATRTMTPLTADQARAFLDHVAGDRFEPLYVLALATGMRQGEMLGLRWQDVDFDSATLTVNHTLRVGTDQLAEPKTERARRTLRLSASVVAALRAQRTRQLEERLAAGSKWDERDFVFTTVYGKPLHASTVNHAFRAALQVAGLPRQRFHDLRHACATLLLEDGEELGVISKILGHATISTTADTYAHVTPAMLQRTADRMDGILRRSS